MINIVKNFFLIAYDRSYLNFLLITFLNFFVFFFEFVSLISIIPLITLIFEDTGSNVVGMTYFIKFFNIFFNELSIKNLAIFVIILSIIKFCTQFFSAYFQEKFSLTSCKRIQKNILSNLIRANYSYLIKVKTSHISNYIFSEVNRVRVSCISLNHFLYNLMSIVVLFIGSSFINIYFSFLTIILGSIYFLTLSPFNIFFARQGKIQKNTRNNILQQIQLVFNNFKNFKILNKNQFFMSEISNTVERLFKSEINSSIAKAIIKNLYEPVLICLTMIMIFFYYEFLVNFKIAEMGALFIIFSRMFSRFATMVQSANQFFLGKSSLLSVIDQERQTKMNKELGTGIEINKINNIEFINTSFSYGKKNVFKNLNFKIEPGSIVSIYGKSGSGKTTIADLIAGFIPLSNGQLLIDDIDIKKINVFSLREKIGYITQDSYLFDGSVRYNLLLTNNKDKDLEIIKILELFELKNLFLQDKIDLDKGIYDKALNISGGQKQRLLITREILKKPDLIIFDESLSQLHKDMRMEVFKKIKRILPNISIINLTHNDEFKSISDKVLEI